MTGAAGMGWSGSCRRGSGAGSLEFGVWSCDSRLMVIWGGGYVVGADGGGVAAVRPPPPFSQAAAAAAGLFGGKFWPLQGRCEAVTLAPLLMVLLL